MLLLKIESIKLPPGADMGAQGGAQTGPSGETVYDADYKVVDDEDKK